jgi:hypothetical protein
MKLKWYQKLGLWTLGAIVLAGITAANVAMEPEKKKFTVITNEGTYQTDFVQYHTSTVAFKADGKRIVSSCFTVKSN